MAVLRQGSVITATVDQSLGNCLLVHFKHRSRTFRGILFDEKNSVVPRASISKQSDDQKLMCNKSSLPLGMAVVSPSKQPYSSLRNRIYYNTTPKRSGGSNSKSSVPKSSDAKSNSQAGSQITGKDNTNSRESSAQTHIRIGKDGLSELDTKHSSRLLRQQCKNTIDIGNSLKRKAESDLAGAKPSKLRSNGASQNTLNVNLNSSKHDSNTSKNPPSRESSRGKVIELGLDSNNKTHGTEIVEEDHPCDQTEIPESTENNMNTTCSLTSVRQNIFPLEQDFKTNNIFSNNEQSEIQDLQTECVDNGSDGAVEFFGRLGLGSACNDGDDGSVYTDSGASCSSNEQLGERTDLSEEEKNSLKDERRLLGAHNNEYKRESYSKQQSLTPTKKSARISAKRAILEQNIESYNDNTIWSIWGGVPSQKQKDRECSPDTHVLVDSPESLTEVVDVRHSDVIADNKSLLSSSRAKGARIKQTPVRSKHMHSNMCVPEKQVSVGNIVWGKVHGHPWWPGRVLAVSGNFGEGSETTKHAHVTWFGSNTSSIMPVNELQHFAANFSRRHKKTKRGCYRKAVKQAQDMLLIMGEEC